MTSEEVMMCIEEIGEKDHFKIVNCVRSYVFSQDVAEDCVQDAYLAALEQCGQIKDSTKLRAWVKKVAIRNAYHCVEKYNRIMRCCVKLYPLWEPEDSRLAAQIVIADTVASVFRSLPERARVIMHLRYINGLRFSEIADKLGMSPAAVRQVHQRTKEKLQNQKAYIRSLMTE